MAAMSPNPISLAIVAVLAGLGVMLIGLARLVVLVEGRDVLQPVEELELDPLRGDLLGRPEEGRVVRVATQAA